MNEKLQGILTASVLAVAPLSVGEIPAQRMERVYIKEEDEVTDILGIVEEAGDRNWSLREEPRIVRTGHFVHRLAGRNNQMGHRYRG